VRIVYELVEPDDRSGSHTEIGIVNKSKVCHAGSACAYRFVRMNVGARRKLPCIGMSLGLYGRGSPDPGLGVRGC
jgi:hypothetical protein